jgi:flagellar hook-associated protein 3 FlgL
MRLTSNMIMRNYLTNLNNSLNTLNDANQTVATGMKFQKMSDDPATGLKAFQVRKNLARIDVYQNNIQDIKNESIDVEASISSLKDIVTNVATQVMQGKTGTYSETDRKAIAAVLQAMQQQILSIANSKIGDKILFGGSNVKNIPFTLDVSGNLQYNGIDVNIATTANETVYSDIGLGLSTDSSNNIIAQSAFNISNSGSDLLGTGVDADGISNNLYNIVGEIATMFENNDLTDIDKYVNKLSEKSDDVLIQYTNIGEKNNFLDFLSSRLDTSKQNNFEKQNNLESVDQAKSIIDYKNQENAYNAALQMGTKILQASLMDYLK